MPGSPGRRPYAKRCRDREKSDSGRRSAAEARGPGRCRPPAARVSLGRPSFLSRRPGLISLQLSQVREVYVLINVGQFHMSFGIARDVVNVNRIAVTGQRRSALQPAVAIAAFVEID